MISAGFFKSSPKSGKILILSFLYLSQGLPFGFQATALPVYLRANGVSLQAIGLVTALAAPWMLKVLWAPLVDRYGSKKIGRRKSWIIPLQSLIFLTILTAAFVPVSENIYILIILVFFMNLFAATQDIAVDGLALDILKPQELGLGNASQVVGYKAGMIVSGGLIVWLSGWLSWQTLFFIMAIISFLPLLMIIFYRERECEYYIPSDNTDFVEIVKNVLNYFKTPGEFWIIIFIASYKLGEIMIDVMFKPFLVDSGYTPSDIGLVIGTWGMAASLFGSIAGGILASNLSLYRALFISLFLRLIPLTGEWMLAMIDFSISSVVVITVFEHFFGGMLTTVMFAFMMSRVNRQVGATHYTILASIEVIGKTPGAWISGFLAHRFGYAFLFGLGTILSALVIFILPVIRNKSNLKL